MVGLAGDGEPVAVGQVDPAGQVEGDGDGAARRDGRRTGRRRSRPSSCWDSTGQGDAVDLGAGRWRGGCTATGTCGWCPGAGRAGSGCPPDGFTPMRTSGSPPAGAVFTSVTVAVASHHPGVGVDVGLVVRASGSGTSRPCCGRCSGWSPRRGRRPRRCGEGAVEADLLEEGLLLGVEAVHQEAALVHHRAEHLGHPAGPGEVAGGEGLEGQATGLLQEVLAPGPVVEADVLLPEQDVGRVLGGERRRVARRR